MLFAFIPCFIIQKLVKVNVLICLFVPVKFSLKINVKCFSFVCDSYSILNVYINRYFFYSKQITKIQVFRLVGCMHIKISKLRNI